ncbi:MAG: dienelactone hydrolase family protein [Alistipes sp.]|nr:dienelactone hydrolase family protein [Alistipes sp.]
MRILVLISLIILSLQQVQAQTVDAMQQWFDTSGKSYRELPYQPFAHKALTRKESEKTVELLKNKWLKDAQARYSDVSDSKVITLDDLKLKIATRIYGQKPADGYSLYISMHGGGSAPARVNDQQWANQIRLYAPKEGVYVAPRAPWNDWNMWFKPRLDELFEMLIEYAVSTLGVNPDKVYLLGYSAGGDGVWRMAPRMADRWAAASMMAGHPGEASQVNLRNTPFMIWMGENDHAFNRNKLAVHHGKIMDSLQTADNAGYIHETHIIESKGHWMERADTAAIAWMAQHRREPYPNKIVWRQEEVTRNSFYWLSLPKNQARKHKMMVVAEYDGNTINIEHSDYQHLTFHLNDEMMNLDKPVTVRYNGKKIFKGRVVRTVATLSETLAQRGDLRYMFPAKLDVEVPK